MKDFDISSFISDSDEEEMPVSTISHRKDVERKKVESQNDLTHVNAVTTVALIHSPPGFPPVASKLDRKKSTTVTNTNSNRLLGRKWMQTSEMKEIPKNNETVAMHHIANLNTLFKKRSHSVSPVSSIIGSSSGSEDSLYTRKKGGLPHVQERRDDAINPAKTKKYELISSTPMAGKSKHLTTKNWPSPIAVLHSQFNIVRTTNARPGQRKQTSSTHALKGTRLQDQFGWNSTIFKNTKQLKKGSSNRNSLDDTYPPPLRLQENFDNDQPVEILQDETELRLLRRSKLSQESNVNARAQSEVTQRQTLHAEVAEDNTKRLKRTMPERNNEDVRKTRSSKPAFRTKESTQVVNAVKVPETANNSPIKSVRRSPRKVHSVSPTESRSENEKDDLSDNDAGHKPAATTKAFTQIVNAVKVPETATNSPIKPVRRSPRKVHSVSPSESGSENEKDDLSDNVADDEEDIPGAKKIVNSDKMSKNNNSAAGVKRKSPFKEQRSSKKRLVVRRKRQATSEDDEENVAGANKNVNSDKLSKNYNDPSVGVKRNSPMNEQTSIRSRLMVGRKMQPTLESVTDDEEDVAGPNRNVNLGKLSRNNNDSSSRVKRNSHIKKQTSVRTKSVVGRKKQPTLEDNMEDVAGASKNVDSNKLSKNVHDPSVRVKRNSPLKEQIFSRKRTLVGRKRQATSEDKIFNSKAEVKNNNKRSKTVQNARKSSSKRKSECLTVSINGLRRSQRPRIKPVSYWTGERVKYKTGSDWCRTMVGIEHKHPVNSEVVQGKKRKRPVSQFTHFLTSEDNPEKKLIRVPFKEGQRELECFSTLRYAGSLGERPEENVSIFTGIETPGIECGYIALPPSTHINDRADDCLQFIFFIIKGRVSVTIHKTRRTLQKGEIFYVPEGTRYGVRNVSDSEAVLSFTRIGK